MTADLADVLGGPVDPAGLTDADRERLAGLVGDARRRQAEALDRAIDGGLRHIPRLLRGTVKALLFR